MNEEAVEMGFDDQIIMRDMQSAIVAALISISIFCRSASGICIVDRVNIADRRISGLPQSRTFWMV
ncbi:MULTISPECIES: hypothetical protein [Sphingobium]|uniref:hypothetical protein n=1 Tax=Sphingobium TaxID=165695 RepID=UPI0015939A78|nr:MULTISPECIES: hypothetical protein [Sphingobium]